MEKENNENLPEPGFIEQANALVEESYEIERKKIEDPQFGHGIKERDHKLLIKINDLFLKVITEQITEQNNDFKEKVIADVNEVIEKQWIRVLDEKLTKFSTQLNGKLEGIAGDVNFLKIHLELVQRQQVQDEIQIELLKKIHEQPKTFDARLRKVEGLIPIVDDLKVYASPKWTGIRWGIFAIIVTLGVLVLIERFPELIHNIFGR